MNPSITMLDLTTERIVVEWDQFQIVVNGQPVIWAELQEFVLHNGICTTTIKSGRNTYANLQVLELFNDPEYSVEITDVKTSSN